MRNYSTFRKWNLFLICILVFSVNALSQNVAITDEDSYVVDPSAMLDIYSLSKGLLIPRLDSVQRKEISDPATGLMVYDTDNNAFYYYNGTNWLSIPQVNTTGTGDALFAVLNVNGDTVFAVYNDGVRVIVPIGAKGKVGGFAISGRSPSKLEPDPEYLRVTPDSTRITFEEGGTKGKVGGFAISGRSPSKSGTLTSSIINLFPDNYFIGDSAGINTTGLYNSIFGYQAAKNNASGSYNIMMGYKSGIENITGHSNIMIGYMAGKSNISGYHNVFIGREVGVANNMGQYNVFIGTGAGAHNVYESFLTMVGVNAGHFTLTGQGNTFLGCNAGWIHENGGNNTYIGTDAGRGGADWPDYNPASPTCENNTFIGCGSGYLIEGGDKNTFLGVNTGRTLTTGDGNVFLGYNAGYSETGSNKLYIENSSANSTSALIYGDFDNNYLRFNANVAIGTTPDVSYKLKVNGNTNIIGTLSATNYSGSVTGNVTGNITGDVNNITIGKFNLVTNATIVSTGGGDYSLLWDLDNHQIVFENRADNEAMIWWQGQEGVTTVGESNIIAAGDGTLIKITDDSYGYEIHFGDASGGTAYCSVWLQYYHGRLVGHFTKF